MANAKTEFYLTCNNRESENVVTDMIGREGWHTPWRGLPGASGPSKCEGTIEDHRNIALDVRELIRKQVFAQPVGTVFCGAPSTRQGRAVCGGAPTRSIVRP